MDRYTSQTRRMKGVRDWQDVFRDPGIGTADFARSGRDPRFGIDVMLQIRCYIFHTLLPS